MTECELSFPEELRNVPLEMGIDETGRGAVLGPMVYCGAFARLGFQWPAYVNDSKQLTKEKRESILENLKPLPIGFVVHALSAEQISSVMLARGSGNLNSMSHATARDLVVAVRNVGLDVRSLYVDTVGNPDHYQQSLQRQFPTISITVCEKADAIYKCVGAASVKAKVTRDNAMRDIVIQEPGVVVDRDFGSGYPGDQATVEWMRRNFNIVFGFPSIARFSWGPVQEIFQKHNAAADWDGSFKRASTDSTFFQQRELQPARIKW